MKHLLEQHMQKRAAPSRWQDVEFDQAVDAGVAWFMNLANATAQDDTVAATDATTDNVVAFTRKPHPVQTFALMAAGSGTKEHGMTTPFGYLDFNCLCHR